MDVNLHGQWAFAYSGGGSDTALDGLDHFAREKPHLSQFPGSQFQQKLCSAPGRRCQGWGKAAEQQKEVSIYNTN